MKRRALLGAGLLLALPARADILIGGWNQEAGEPVVAALAEAGGNADLTLVPQNAGRVVLTAPLKLPEYVFATLAHWWPCNAENAGGLASVSDATAREADTAVEGGGTERVLAYCNGAEWRVK